MGSRIRTSFLVLILGGFIFSVSAPAIGVAAAVFTGAGSGHGRDVVVARDGSVYVTGVFSGTVDFDPGPGRDARVAVDGYDVFVTRYAPDGAYLGTRTFGRAGDDESGGVELSESGDVTLSGNGELGPFVEQFRVGE